MFAILVKIPVLVQAITIFCTLQLGQQQDGMIAHNSALPVTTKPLITSAAWHSYQVNFVAFASAL